MWCVAELDEKYMVHMEDVLEVYEKPYDPKQPVVCLDEKPIALHADVRPASPAAPGREARRDNEYKRCGTANVSISKITSGLNSRPSQSWTVMVEAMNPELPPVDTWS